MNERENTTARATTAALVTTSLLALDGCQVVKDIFGVGVGVGMAIVIGVVVLGGVIAAVVTRK